MSTELRNDARTIWKAGVDAVDSGRLVRNVVRVADGRLTVCGHEFSLDGLKRIAVVGAGKAGAGMASAIEEVLGAELLNRVSGWINVPADCVRRLQKIHLHAARPAGVNEPTVEGVAGSERILDIVSQLDGDDLCLVLLSGGGSALLPAPVAGITLEDKQEVTRLLMRAGTTINELNCVRKRLSRIKGGKLASASRAGTTIALVISDVIGDPLETIASGPTVADSSTDAEALGVLRKYAPDAGDIPQSVLEVLVAPRSNGGVDRMNAVTTNVHNYVIGNNGVALKAAAAKARELGYAVHSLGSENQGVAREVGRELAELALSIRDGGGPVSVPGCVLSGGEPVVQVARTDRPQKGGRNQELVLAAVERLQEEGMEGIAILSGGTDGEDGPTDAAGAVADANVLAAAIEKHLHPSEFLSINNSYPFFDQTGGLLKTGPTHTNVMDLRVVVVGGVARETGSRRV